MTKPRIDRIDRRWKMRGYTYCYRPEHPYALSGGSFAEHRLVMENYLRINNPSHPALVEVNGELYLSRDWEVHHKNQVRDDNRIENLEAILPEDHHKIRNRGWIDGKTNNLSRMRYGNKHRVTLTCVTCKKNFEVRLSWAKNGRKYCTRACRVY